MKKRSLLNLTVMLLLSTCMLLCVVVGLASCKESGLGEKPVGFIDKYYCFIDGERIEVSLGDVITVPTEPDDKIEDGYEFIGWEVREQTFKPGDSITLEPSMFYPSGESWSIDYPESKIYMYDLSYKPIITEIVRPVYAHYFEDKTLEWDECLMQLRVREVVNPFCRGNADVSIQWKTDNHLDGGWLFLDKYDFEGWYLDEEYTKEFWDFSDLKASGIGDEVHLYAKWTYTGIVYEEYDAKRWRVAEIDLSDDIDQVVIPSVYGRGKKCDYDDAGYEIIGITAGAFNGCSSLETVSMGSVTSIGEYAFAGCTKLSSIIMPKATTIDRSAFNGCISLETVSMESVTSIGEYAFADCTKLSSVNIPNATTVGKNAFNGCTSLETVSMESATSIDEYTFADCTKLSSVNIPNATTVGKNAFNGCTSLETVSVESVTSIGEYAFAGCTELSSVNIPNATTVGKNAFNGCSSLESLRAGRLKAIESGAFKDCESLDFFLLYCSTGLTIADDAFSGCGYIDEIYCENENASYWEKINGTKPEGTVYFYSEYEQSIEKYLQTKTLSWHYDENGNPEFWIHINDTLSGKTLTSTKENARVILTEYTWAQLYGAKQNGLLVMIQDADLRTAIENAETKEDLDAYFTSKLNVVDATLVFETDGTVTIYNGKFPEGYKYEYIEINDRLILTDPEGVETLVGEFYFDTDGHVYEIQPFSMEGMEGYGNSDEGFANVRFDYYEVIEKN